MTYEDLPSQAFNDPRNVTVGKARVIWANACGRHRTQNRMTAQHAAELMHRMMLVGRY